MAYYVVEDFHVARIISEVGDFNVDCLIALKTLHDEVSKLVGIFPHFALNLLVEKELVSKGRINKLPIFSAFFWLKLDAFLEKVFLLKFAFFLALRVLEFAILIRTFESPSEGTGNNWNQI